MVKAYFNKHERAILQTLYRERRSMTIKELANETTISWITIKKYLTKLENRKYINRIVYKKTKKEEKEETKKRIAWEINYNKISD